METFSYTIMVEDIVWDLEVDYEPQEVQGLPTSYLVEDIIADDADEAIDSAIDHVSDIFGWCILDSNPRIVNFS